MCTHQQQSRRAPTHLLAVEAFAAAANTGRMGVICCPSPLAAAMTPATTAAAHQEMLLHTTTRSPGFRVPTSGPTSSTAGHRTLAKSLATRRVRQGGKAGVMQDWRYKDMHRAFHTTPVRAPRRLTHAHHLVAQHIAALHARQLPEVEVQVCRQQEPPGSQGWWHQAPQPPCRPAPEPQIVAVVMRTSASPGSVSTGCGTSPTRTSFAPYHCAQPRTAGLPVAGQAQEGGCRGAGTPGPCPAAGRVCAPEASTPWRDSPGPIHCLREAAGCP